MAEFDELLISSVELYPCIYNTKCQDFKVNTKKENAWKAIAEKVTCTVDVAQKRWKTLRERYAKELRKKNKPTGTGADEVAKEWEYFQLMSFLKDFIKHRKTVSNMVDVSDTTSSTVDDSSPQATTDSIDGSEADVDSNERTPTEVKREYTPKLPSAKKRKTSIDSIEVEILRQLKDSSVTAEETDEEYLFGKTVAIALKRLSPLDKSSAKIRIQQLLHSIEYGPTPPPQPPTSFSNCPTVDYFYGYNTYERPVPPPSMHDTTNNQ